MGIWILAPSAIVLDRDRAILLLGMERLVRPQRLYRPSYPPAMPPQGPSALEILRQRYARGEIDAATFEQMRERLESTAGPREL